MNKLDMALGERLIDRRDKSIQNRIRINEQRPCINHCGNKRTRLSRFCYRCNYRYYNFGDPNGFAIPRSYYSAQIKDCRRLMDMNRGNKGVQYALKFCARYLEVSNSGMVNVPNPMGRLGYLHRKGVTAMDMLVEASAIYCYFMNSPRAGLSYQIGNAVLKLRRCNRRFYGKHRKAVGDYLLSGLRPLFKKLHESIKNEKDSEARLESALETNWVDGAKGNTTN